MKPRAELGRRLWTSFPDLFPHVIWDTQAPGDSRTGRRLHRDSGVNWAREPEPDTEKAGQGSDSGLTSLSLR